MDTLEFKITPNKQVDICINGVRLIDRLKKYEYPFARQEGVENLAGGYSSLYVQELFRRLTQPDDYDLDDNGKIAVLECECGCGGCWPMHVKIDVHADKIVWSEFEQPHRSAERVRFWDYTAFGKFEFSHTNYFMQLEVLAHECNQRFIISGNLHPSFYSKT